MAVEGSRMDAPARSWQCTASSTVAVRGLAPSPQPTQLLGMVIF